MRLVPKSLFGQVMLALGLALLVAQVISAALLYRAMQERREDAMLNAAAYHLGVGAAERGRIDQRVHRRDGTRMRGPDGPGLRLPRRFRYETSTGLPLLPGETADAERAEALAELLSARGIVPGEVIVTTRRAIDDPLVAPFLRRAGVPQNRANQHIIVAAIRADPDTPWQVARVPVPPAETAPVRLLVMQVVLVLLLLAAPLFLILRQLTRPLGALTRRTEAFAASGNATGPLAPAGPDDLRRLIAAHNAMEMRIGSMLDEKDVMLGAIGHDLKTPLAALRVRIESVPDEIARAKMAATIEDIARTLDDILSLARVGRADGAAERVDLAALAASVVEEYEDMSEPVTLQASPRVVAPVRETWLKRALRNLVGNALRYGGTARVSLLEREGRAVLQVDDDGPGIPADRIASMLEPFQRGETSRNRATGGAGLGLTLARAIAEQHGGTLVLANRPQGGLRAEIRLPL